VWSMTKIHLDRKNFNIFDIAHSNISDCHRFLPEAIDKFKWLAIGKERMDKVSRLWMCPEALKKNPLCGHPFPFTHHKNAMKHVFGEGKDGKTRCKAYAKEHKIRRVPKKKAPVEVTGLNNSDRLNKSQ